jgi:hypothetical protein
MRVEIRSSRENALVSERMQGLSGFQGRLQDGFRGLSQMLLHNIRKDMLWGNTRLPPNQ